MTTRNKYLLKHYGITEVQYDELFQKQRGCCPICLRHASTFKTRLAVEHDHWSGQIRGLVCSYCNRRVIGRWRTPSGQDVLKRVIQYLDGPYIGWVVPLKIKKKRRKKRRCTTK